MVLTIYYRALLFALFAALHAETFAYIKWFDGLLTVRWHCIQRVNMSAAFTFAMLISGLAILSWREVEAQSTVDDSGSCESSTFDEAVNIIRKDLKDVKNLCGSNQQHSSAVDTSSLCEYRNVLLSICAWYSGSKIKGKT